MDQSVVDKRTWTKVSGQKVMDEINCEQKGSG